MSTIPNPWPPIGQLFVEHGRLSSSQLEDALEAQQRTGNPLGEILIERGYISRIDLAGALSKQWSWDDDTDDSPAVFPAEPVSTLEPEPALEPEPTIVAVELEAAFAQFSANVAQPSADAQPARVSEAAEVRIEAFAELVDRVSGLEQQERVIVDLQSRLRAAHEQLAAGESRLREVETLVTKFAEACARLAAQSDAQTAELTDLRQAMDEQAERVTSAARALLP
jgi:hypothetical protein